MNDNYYTMASKGGQVTDLLGDARTYSVFEPAQVSRDLYLERRKGLQYLFIDGNKSRFHEVVAGDDTIVGKRYISDIFSKPGQTWLMPDLPVDELYLVFIKSGDTRPQQEYYKIQFPKATINEVELNQFNKAGKKGAEKQVLLGNLYEWKKDLGSAIDAYSHALILNEKCYDAYVQRATVYVKIGKTEQAIADCDKAVVINPQDQRAYVIRGSIYNTMEMDISSASYRENKIKALYDFSRAIELNPNNAELYGIRAKIYLFLRNQSKSMNDYDKAISLAPNNRMFYEERAMQCAIAGDWDKSLEYRNKIVELAPQDSIAYFNRAIASEHVSNTNTNQAIMDYSKAIELCQGQQYNNSLLSNIYTERGRAFHVNGQNDEAIADLNKAISLQTGLAGVYLFRGAAYFDKGDYDQAIEDCTKYIELSSLMHSPQAYLVRGKAYKAKGMSREALSDFNIALGIKPDLKEAIVEKNSLQ
jgi:tetratricopeptide (TPR) repeat protein